MATITTAILPGNRRPQNLGKRIAVAMLLVLAFGGGSPASALPLTGTMPPGTRLVNRIATCVPAAQVLNFTATPSNIDFGTSATLSWNVQVPDGNCGYMLVLNGQLVGWQGSLMVRPLADTTYVLTLSRQGSVISVPTTAITVNLPVDPADPTRRKVTIDRNELLPTFLRALSTSNTTVDLEVDLDLSNLRKIALVEGVTLHGGRTARPGTPYQAGPRLYTSTYPDALFEIQGDRVHVTGVRVEGPEMGNYAGDDEGPVGILVSPHFAGCDPPSWQSIEIDHNELSGWSHAAVKVTDKCSLWPTFAPKTEVPSHFDPASYSIVYDVQSGPVQIHDNYIHHNQHEWGNGYGVAVAAGAHALIERNVFDWNRHAISGEDGTSGSGYRAYSNLVRENGGVDKCYGGVTGVLASAFGGPCYYTHQFDMHGFNKDCGLLTPGYYCGTAGHDLDIRYNSFLYTNGPAIKVRGTPELHPYGAVVRSNVFAHEFLEYAAPYDAVEWTETGVWVDSVPYNRLRAAPWQATDSCDFDGDGINDSFLPTGQTWWYCPGGGTCDSSPGSGKATWVYLNTSTLELPNVSLGYFDGDHVCDVVAGGLISSGGAGPWRPLIRPRLSGVIPG